MPKILQRRDDGGQVDKRREEAQSDYGIHKSNIQPFQHFLGLTREGISQLKDALIEPSDEWKAHKLNFISASTRDSYPAERQRQHHHY